MSWVSKFFNRTNTKRKLNINGMSFDELITTAQRGSLDGVSDSVRVKCLLRAASIAQQSNDMKELLIVNSIMLSFKENGLIN